MTLNKSLLENRVVTTTTKVKCDLATTFETCLNQTTTKDAEFSYITNKDTHTSTLRCTSTAIVHIHTC